MTSESRFWAKARLCDPDDCWPWDAARDTDGYGHFRLDGRTVKAHRVAWFLTYGKWPTQTLDHLCRVRHCVNPAHLEDVSGRENTLRGVGPTALNAVKTHCPSGHAYEGANLEVSRGRRTCRQCQRAAERRYRDKCAGVGR